MTKYGQPRYQSLIEACSNVVVGFFIATFANYYILPLFNLPVSLHDSFWIAVIFTIISVIRSYIMRRVFNFVDFATRFYKARRWYKLVKAATDALREKQDEI